MLLFLLSVQNIENEKMPPESWTTLQYDGDGDKFITRRRFHIKKYDSDDYVVEWVGRLIKARLTIRIRVLIYRNQVVHIHVVAAKDGYKLAREITWSSIGGANISFIETTSKLSLRDVCPPEQSGCPEKEKWQFEEGKISDGSWDGAIRHSSTLNVGAHILVEAEIFSKEHNKSYTQTMQLTQDGREWNFVESEGISVSEAIPNCDSLLGVCVCISTLLPRLLF